MPPLKNISAPDRARLWANTDHSGGPNACWLWTGYRDKYGYGIIVFSGRKTRAHRAAFIAKFGMPPKNKPCVCHSCDNPPCCNPAHLWAGTHAENALDRHSKGRTATGLKSGAYTHPWIIKRGDAHHSRINPSIMPRGKAHGMAVLTNWKIRAIRELHAKGWSQRQLSRNFKTCRSNIRQILDGITWRHVA